MSDSVLDRFSRSHVRTEHVPSSSERGQEEFDNHGAFCCLRGIRDKAVMLQLRRKDGTIRAIGYAWLHEVQLDPSTSITLHSSGGTIRLVGRNLNREVSPGIRLFEGITRHRVTFVQEADRAADMQAKDGDTVIERIEW